MSDGKSTDDKVNWDGFIARFHPVFELPGAVLVDYERSFSPQECILLKGGYLFGDDDGKWIILPVDNTLYFYGLLMKLCFVLRFEAEGQGWKTSEIQWYRDVFRCDDAERVSRVVTFLVDLLLLKKEAQCPFPKDLPKDIRTQGLYRFSLVGNATAPGNS
ncbi:hypothetical protein BH10CYA1_BH10CYA1_59200 [soil metagenome]